MKAVVAELDDDEEQTRNTKKVRVRPYQTRTFFVFCGLHSPLLQPSIILIKTATYAATER
jgi:hypothetical protein